MQINLGNVSQICLHQAEKKLNFRKSFKENPIQMILLNPLNVKPVFGNTSRKNSQVEKFE